VEKGPFWAKEIFPKQPSGSGVKKRQTGPRGVGPAKGIEWEKTDQITRAERAIGNHGGVKVQPKKVLKST